MACRGLNTSLLAEKVSQRCKRMVRIEEHGRVIRTVEIRTTVPYLSATASWLTDSKIAGSCASTGDSRATRLLTYRDRSVSSASCCKTGYRDNWLFITRGWDLQENMCTRWRLLIQVVVTHSRIRDWFVRWVVRLSRKSLRVPPALHAAHPHHRRPGSTSDSRSAPDGRHGCTRPPP